MNQEPKMARILIVDDESGIRDSLKDYFELEGFDVVTAQSGNEAIALITASHFDLVLSDIRMPNGDGRYLLKSIRQLNFSQPVVVLMSGYSDLSLEEAFAEGAADLIPKPFNPVELLNNVKSYLRESNEKWKTKFDQPATYKTQIQASSLQEAVDKKLISCGLSGIFLNIDPIGYRVGENLEITLNDVRLHMIGIIRWVRTVERAERLKGLGLEIQVLSEEFKSQFLKIIDDSKSGAIIPLT
jgi:DNA-binding response OmpR family regulator